MEKKGWMDGWKKEEEGRRRRRRGSIFIYTQYCAVRDRIGPFFCVCVVVVLFCCVCGYSSVLPSNPAWNKNNFRPRQRIKKRKKEKKNAQQISWQIPLELVQDIRTGKDTESTHKRLLNVKLIRPPLLLLWSTNPPSSGIHNRRQDNNPTHELDSIIYLHQKLVLFDYLNLVCVCVYIDLLRPFPHSIQPDEWLDSHFIDLILFFDRRDAVASCSYLSTNSSWNGSSSSSLIISIW